MARKTKIEKEQERIAHSLSVWVGFSVFVLLLYTIVEQVLSTITGVSHDTLTTCFFTAFGLENVLCAGIKISKVLKGEKEEEI